MNKFETLQARVNEIIEQEKQTKQPLSLYEPVDYAIHQKGKRLRPLLVLIATDMFNTDIAKAEKACMAIELLHNFTLVHDDIMDASPLRRGVPTIYQKYGINKAILSGDVMYALSYQYILQCEKDKIPSLTKTLTSVLINICEGQALDMAFEERNDVSQKEYITMISLKTGILFAGALKMGAIIADANVEDMNSLSEFGLYLGIAFQLQDDVLDCWSDLSSFGKVSGTDIADNKKTILYLLAMEKANDEDKALLNKLYTEKIIDIQKKIQDVKAIFEKYNIKESVETMIEQYTDLALNSLNKISTDEESKSNLKTFINQLLNRNK
ncbi:MAG: polyprenyl synthetase family protein [Bacteroidales bacterium]|nr:polyprenyl synthetase family protein [Bacteroidales bacterium]